MPAQLFLHLVEMCQMFGLHFGRQLVMLDRGDVCVQVVSSPSGLEVLSVRLQQSADSIEPRTWVHPVVQVQHFLMLPFSQGVLHNFLHLWLGEVVRLVQLAPCLSCQFFHVLGVAEGVVHV